MPRDLDAAPDDDAIEAERYHAADEAQLMGDDGEYEVVVAFGRQVVPHIRALSEAVSPYSSGCDGVF